LQVVVRNILMFKEAFGKKKGSKRAQNHRSPTKKLHESLSKEKV
jgi:hypothetical protein